MAMDELDKENIERIVALEEGQKRLEGDMTEMKGSLKELSSAIKQLTGFLTGSIDNMGQSVIFEIKTLATDMKRAYLRLDAHEEKISDHGTRLLVVENHLETFTDRMEAYERRQQDEIARLQAKAAALVPAPAAPNADPSKFGALEAFFNGIPVLFDILKKWGPALTFLTGIGAYLLTFIK